MIWNKDRYFALPLRQIQNSCDFTFQRQAIASTINESVLISLHPYNLPEVWAFLSSMTSGTIHTCVLNA